MIGCRWRGATIDGDQCVWTCWHDQLLLDVTVCYSCYCSDFLLQHDALANSQVQFPPCFSLLVSVPISPYFSRTDGCQVSSGLSTGLQVRWQGGRVSSGVLLWLTQMAPGCVAQSIFCRSGWFAGCSVREWDLSYSLWCLLFLLLVGCAYADGAKWVK